MSMGEKFSEKYQEYVEKHNKLFEILEKRGIEDEILFQIHDIIDLARELKIMPMHE